MKTIVIAAGYATRLGELTKSFPKPLLKIGESTILGRMLDDIDRIPDIDEHIIVTNHKFAHIFEEWAKEQHYNNPITIIDDGTETNETRLGAVCDLLLAIDHIEHRTQPFNPSTPQPFNPSTPQPFNSSTPQPFNPSTPQPFNSSTPQPFNPSTLQPFNPSTPQPFNSSTPQPFNPSTLQPFTQPDLLVVAADNILFFSFQEFVDFAKEKNTSCIMCHEQPSIEKLQRTGVILVDENMKVLNMEEKPEVPKSHWAVPPFYIYMKHDLDLVKHSVENGCGKDAPGNLAHYMVDRTTMHAWPMSAGRFDIGSLDTYKEACVRFGKHN